MTGVTTESDVEHIELNLLLTAINNCYGYDFRSYAESSIRRRVLLTMRKLGCRNISELTHNVLIDKEAFEELFLNFSISVTKMFRDPISYRLIRDSIVPRLAELDHIKIWHAGCSTGEEVYSMAILLKECGVYDKTQIYATDINAYILNKAKDGIYKSDLFRGYTKNYQLSGGAEPFSNYYTADRGYAVMADSLKRNILFSDHNLVTDSVFGEMNMIICRNVMIYFNRELQNKVFELFHESLTSEGFIWLGKKETIKFTEFKAMYDVIDGGEKIFQKRR